MKNLLLKILNKLNDLLLYLLKKLNNESSLKLINKTFDSDMNCYKIIFHNKSNKQIEDLLKDLFYFLKKRSSKNFEITTHTHPTLLERAY